MRQIWSKSYSKTFDSKLTLPTSEKPPQGELGEISSRLTTPLLRRRPYDWLPLLLIAILLPGLLYGLLHIRVSGDLPPLK